MAVERAAAKRVVKLTQEKIGSDDPTETIL